MARGIPIDGIADFLEGEINEIVRETTIDLHGKLQTYKALNRNGYGTPVDSGDLIRAWQMTMDNPLQGRVFNNLVYAEPVIDGKNLPRSWVDSSGAPEYKTRQGTVPGYPDSIAKEVAEKSVPKIINEVRRRRG
tara:strand:- start:340 stop:741 length:402 start_codon:yes stop_codon:yes gene_type:complete